MGTPGVPVPSARRVSARCSRRMRWRARGRAQGRALRASRTTVSPTRVMVPNMSDLRRVGWGAAPVSPEPEMGAAPGLLLPLAAQAGDDALQPGRAGIVAVHGSSRDQFDARPETSWQLRHRGLAVAAAEEAAPKSS